MKFKPTRPISESTEFELESVIARKTDNSEEKLTYARILRQRGNTDIYRKLSKQKITEINNNTSLAQKLQTNTKNKRDCNKPRSSASSTLKVDEENQKTTKRSLKQEIKKFKLKLLL